MVTTFSKNIKELIISIFAFFKQAAKLISTKYSTTLAGNLDPFYIFGGIYLINVLTGKTNLKKYFLYAIPIIIYALIQIIVLPICYTELSILKVGINILKICLCIGVMLYVYENYQKIDLLNVVKFFSFINLIFLIVALTIQKTSFLWRLNDYYNDYSKTRLQMFFLEPSEYGFHIAIVMIFLLVFLFVAKETKNRWKIIIYLGINAIAMIMAKPMGAICIFALACWTMFTYFMIRKPTKKNVLIYIFSILVVIIIAMILISQSNSIAMRVIDTLNGNDKSNDYRIGVSFKTFGKSLKDYGLLGCGFGNINTEQFMNKYFLPTVIVNSFIYFWIETGLFGIVYSSVLIWQLFKACKKSKSTLKWGLFVFLIVYQFFGSHFVSPLNWALYGIIFSNYHEKAEEMVEMER